MECSTSRISCVFDWLVLLWFVLCHLPQARHYASIYKAVYNINIWCKWAWIKKSTIPAVHISSKAIDKIEEEKKDEDNNNSFVHLHSLLKKICLWEVWHCTAITSVCVHFSILVCTARTEPFNSIFVQLARIQCPHRDNIWTDITSHTYTHYTHKSLNIFSHFIPFWCEFIAITSLCQPTVCFINLYINGSLWSVLPFLGEIRSMYPFYFGICLAVRIKQFRFPMAWSIIMQCSSLFTHLMTIIME